MVLDHRPRVARLSVIYFHAWNSIVIIVLVLIYAFPRMKQTLFGQPTPEMEAYYDTHISNRLSMALMYLGLLAALDAGLLGRQPASRRPHGRVSSRCKVARRV